MKRKFTDYIYGWGCCATILLPIASMALVPMTTRETETFTIRKLERIVDADGTGARYLVFTENETFENTDELFLFKFNSSDLHGKMQPGDTYKAQVVGVRMPIFSSYRNIISVEKLDPSVKD